MKPKKPKLVADETISASRKSSAGRPSKWDDRFITVARKACELGATDLELGEMLGVSERTIQTWRAEKPEFAEALKVGKAPADDRVRRGLYQRAVGYSYESTKIFMPAGASEPVYAPFVEHVPPDPTAAIFWLKNRLPDEWRDRKAVEHSGPDGGPINFANLPDEELTARIKTLHAELYPEVSK